jgi:CRISPR-associated protein Cas1
VLPMTSNNTYTENVRKQLDASEPLKKQLWKQTIQAKIRNQAALLKSLEKPWEGVFALIEKVGSGDPSNIEGRAAATYWKYLFEDIDGFTRGRDGDAPNHLLNYGYAILRATVARSLIGSGLLPLAGIHHKNKYNAFCLADDIMEPYRPFVDQLVWGIVRDYANNLPDELNKELKGLLLQIPALDVMIEEKKSPLMVGVQRTTASLMRCFEGETRKIAYPEM